MGVPTRVSQGKLLRVLRRVTTQATPTLRTSVTFWEAAAPAKLPAMLSPWLTQVSRPGGGSALFHQRCSLGGSPPGF